MSYMRDLFNIEENIEEKSNKLIYESRIEAKRL